MIFLGLEKIDNTRGKIGLTHYFPEQLSAEDLKAGVLVDTIVDPENISGKVPVGYYDYATKSVYYKYQDMELTETDILAQRIQEQENALLELASMLGGGQ